MNTAAVIYLPSASNTPIVQTRVRGRLPKAVGSLHRAQMKAASEKFDDSLIQDTIRALAGYRAELQRDADGVASMINRIKRDAQTPDRRDALVSELMTDGLCFYIRGVFRTSQKRGQP